eukprot:CAMPEP_0172502888 /NCGR_PEP_ID=MMETSP1066-20121228/163646_1 /TAXON_ID=671091 /ORGANISM="Coscinodiscus wailesii, Strain CCMP2513" /LENGTH=248 /DNA_ID=CAMNT_0013278331 /DNA_START=20 /DNA_END=766 /DNA_ORIENTATION=-
MLAFALTSAAIAQFASKPFIRNAIVNPNHPFSVLSFFYGVDYKDPTASDVLRKGAFVKEMAPFWFDGHKDYDELCKEFVPVIRSAGRHELVEDSWQVSIDGKMAQLILTDQLPRNAFRGNDEAFQYDEIALTIARELSNIALDTAAKTAELEGEFYGPYANNLILALMHSESLSDHEICLEMCEWGQFKAPQMGDWWSNKRDYTLAHTKVIEQFGRYPYRNSKKGRENTPEEAKWLASDDLPIWAKSQ